MRALFLLLSMFFLLSGCGGESSKTRSELSGRYVGILSGKLCGSDNTVIIEVVHDLDVSAAEDGEPVNLVDQQGTLYKGGFTIIARPDGNFYGFSVTREDDTAFTSPLVYSYNFSGMPIGRALVVGFLRDGSTGGCDEFYGELVKILEDV